MSSADRSEPKKRFDAFGLVLLLAAAAILVAVAAFAWRESWSGAFSNPIQIVAFALVVFGGVFLATRGHHAAPQATIAHSKFATRADIEHFRIGEDAKPETVDQGNLSRQFHRRDRSDPAALQGRKAPALLRADTLGQIGLDHHPEPPKSPPQHDRH